jgi:GT2 family glycosyltransferase
MSVPPVEISVVISTYERPRPLAGALQALARQQFPKDRFEVILVNDGGVTALESVAHPFERQLQIRILSQPNNGPGAGRNLGAAHARGALLAFTDDDCQPHTDWLCALQRAAHANPDCLLGGRTIAGFPQELCSEASQLILDAVYGFYNSQPANARFFASNNMAVPAGLFRVLGGFDTAFRLASEDRDLCERWRNSGRRMVYVSDATVEHFQRLNFASFIRLHFRYGRGAWRFHQERIRRGSSRLRDHLGLYREWRRWLLGPWREQPRSRAAAMELLLFSWQAANATGFLYGCLFDRA